MGGGGGGAGGGGADATSGGSGNGGVGIAVWGNRYAGGGGGGTRDGSLGTAVDGGGVGGYGLSGSGTEGGEDGTPNTGGGGGGGGGGGTGTPIAPAGSGGSGIVIIRYAVAPSVGVANTTATNLTATTADLLGRLDAPQSVFAVRVYWSTSNNVTQAEWEADNTASSAVLGTYTNVVGLSLSNRVSSLTSETQYYYAYMASNAETNIWALPRGAFETVPGSSSNQYSFTVSSLYGTPDPSGTTTYNLGTTVNFAMPGSPVEVSGTTQYVATGWVSTGSLTSGTGTNGSFTITNDTTLIWQWTTNYWIELNTLGQ
jgi:hypothetical protein